MVAATKQARVDQIWDWLRLVPDPEIPVISVVDLGVVRDVRWERDQLVVSVTPTYSGCPATGVIAQDINEALRAHGIESLRLETQLSPPWTTDWITDAGKERLRQYGIAPPAARGESSVCPRCASPNIGKVSEFGSTPCKAQYQCRECLEPFDLFKCI